MKTLSKTLDVKDYDKLSDINSFVNSLRAAGIVHRFEHTHRRWEYGITHYAINSMENPAETILDVGGGGSVFAPWIASHTGASVTQVDPGDVGEWIRKQSQLINKPLEFIQKDFMEWRNPSEFDVVTCLSVIEHVPDDIRFFCTLCEKVKYMGLLILTTDFYPSGEAKVDGHIRTYNEEGMRNFVKIAEMYGLHPYGGEPDYSLFGINVNSYTFASLVLRKDEDVNFRIAYSQ